MKNVVCFLAVEGAGKDTAGDVAVTRGYTRIALADPLKEEVAAAFGVTVDLLNNRATKEMDLPEMGLVHCRDPHFVGWARTRGCLEWAANSPRKVMQCWGDFRREGDTEYFVGQALVKIQGIPGDVVVTDLRRWNEYHALVEAGAVLIRVTRPGYAPVNTHPTAVELNEVPTDHVVDNSGSIEDLHRKVEGILATLGS